VTGRWFSPGTPVSSTNKTDCHDITEKLLKVELNTITLIKQYRGKFLQPEQRVNTLTPFMVLENKTN
jgi:hypothetical protein